MTAPRHPAGDAPLFWRPEDLPAWRRWQRAQWPAARRAADAVRTLRARLRRDASSPEEGLRVLVPAGPVHTLVAVESAGPTQRAALVEPVLALAAGRAAGVTDPAAVLAGVGWVMPAETAESLRPELPAGTELTTVSGVDPDLSARLDGLRRVLVAGEYLPAGQAAVRWARERGAEVAVVQHGLLAVSTPPVPRAATLYAFTAQDAAWWAQGRTDVQAVPVGSALLEHARRAAPAPGAGDHDAGPGVFLGQLHGAELPRTDFVRAAEEYLRATGAVYRPHPAERDRLSRAQHARWEGAGVVLDRTGVPLASTTGPVAAVFSTGILEAAQAGRPAWAVHPDPPAWLEGFWERYGITRWTPGTPPSPTPPLSSPTPDPAAAIADHLWRST
ncbi:RNA-binding protein [Micrococcus sp.]|uniref:RNA-binding protein n=1 Tax=Micrococcus sp. TaxID=1271 RepID=UPI002A91CD62|nr:RNA-binding protein [Micrococcus sp.]MDY6054796.1 RNA-binding protein [Micrococcus sp.]